ncbi:histidinol-phosphate transaminase [Candidatus Woesearchaeota archaeon]|nr:histidinol-phosphate transaminase [Candidatus Woesearchaeota archaeon]
MVVFIIVPKNTGLETYRTIALSSFSNKEKSTIIEARGEDIPFLVKQFQEQGKPTFGLTGEDLFKEYLLKDKNTSLRVIKKITWDDPAACFRKPTLCFIGPDTKDLLSLPKVAKVCVAAKYKRLAKRYLNFLERKGFAFQKIYINGCVETTCQEGIADVIIDIVYTGNSLKKFGLKVYDTIFQSDFVIIGADNTEQNTPTPRSVVQTLKVYDPPLEQRQGKLCLDFNENTRGCSPQVIKALKKINMFTVSQYPEYKEFTKELASFLIIPPSNLRITNATDEAIKLIMDTYLTKDDEVIIPQPTFALFQLYATLSEAKIISVLYNNDLSFPTDAVLEKINDKTKLIVLVNPNNPTGTVISEEDILRILTKARKSMVLIDEAYYQYYGKSSMGLIEKYPNLIIIQTFSKAFGLAGLRLGYIIASAEIINNLKKASSPYSVNALALVAARAALQDLDFVDSYVSEVKVNRERLMKELTGLGLQVFASQANFLVVNAGSRCNELCEKLKQQNILVRNRTSYPLLQNCVRIGVGTKKQGDQLLGALKNILPQKILLFDMDGVLVDVRQSYRRAIQETAAFFTQARIDPSEIEQLKRQGGYNNDWDLTEALILKRGITIPKQLIIETFQEIYWGNETTRGYIEDEKWLFSQDTLEQLYKNYRLGIVTGRPRQEATFILEKFAVAPFFDTVIVMEDYPSEKAKPNPYPLRLALQRLGKKSIQKTALYLGDNIDDIIAAQRAGIRAIGILSGNDQSNQGLQKKFLQQGAQQVLEDVNAITKVIV